MKQIIVNIAGLVVVMIAVVPFYAHAQINWIYRYNGLGGSSDDEALSLDYGSDGNIYVAGYSSNDFTVISLAPIGDTNWVYRYDGSSSEYGMAYDLVFGGDSNIYVAGYLYDSITHRDFAVISLTMAGDENWVYRYGYSNSDGAYAIVHGADGNIYAAGMVDYATTGDDFTVISLTDSGDIRWVYHYPSPEDLNEGASSIVYGLDGNIYAAGGIGYCFAVVSLTSAGDTNWVYLHDGWEAEAAVSIVYGADGNIYAAGISFSGEPFDWNSLVISLTTSGNENWVYEYDEPYEDDGVNQVVYGGDTNIYVAGYRGWVESCPDFTVISIDTAGSTNWTYQYNGMGTEWPDDEATSLVYGSDGNIYAAGYSTGIGTGSDFTVISLTTAGTRRWLYRYNGPGNGSDIAWSMDYGVDNNIYVAGRSTGAGTGYDFIVISMGQAGFVSENKAENLSVNYINVLPNPFSRYARINVCVSPVLTPSSLYLYDVAGRLQDIIWQDRNELPKSLIYKPPSHIASGVYYLMLDVAGIRYVKRVVLVR